MGGKAQHGMHPAAQPHHPTHPPTQRQRPPTHPPTHLQDLDNHVLVLGEDLGKAVCLLNQVLHRRVALHQPKALLGLQGGDRERQDEAGGRGSVSKQVGRVSAEKIQPADSWLTSFPTRQAPDAHPPPQGTALRPPPKKPTPQKTEAEEAEEEGAHPP